MNLKFDNVTISGGIAVGTSTLAKNLKPYLKPYGWKFFSGGDHMRDYAIKHNLFDPSNKHHHSAKIFTDEYEKEIDFGMKERLETHKNLVLEAWLSGFFARELPNTLRVLLICSNEAIRIDRIVNRESVSIEDAKLYIKEREGTNFEKWKRMYGEYNFFNPDYYQIVIDTYTSGPLETLGIVLDTLGYDSGTITVNKNGN